MSLILSGTDGISDVDGSASTPALRGTDANTGIFFPAADTIAFSEGGVESMRIDSSGNVVQGTTTWGYAGNNGYQIRSGAGNNSALFLETASATIKTLLASDTNASLASLGTLTNHPLRFVTNDAERMRIDTSGNVGIGTSSPGKRLHVALNTASDYAVFRISNSGSTATIDMGVGGSSVGGALANNAYLYNTGNSAFVFGTNDTERMRISAGGAIVGIGTSSPSSVAGQSLQLGNRSAAFQLDVNGDLYTSHNMYYDGANWRYMVSGEASMTDFGNGRVNFFRAVSGTSGATVTLIPTLTIDNSDATSVILQKGTLTFPSTQNPSANANTLDDYEEGTWSPTVPSGFTSPTYGNQTGRYVKVGKICYFSFRLLINGGTRAGSIVQITLPFTTPSLVNGFAGAGYWSYASGGVVNSLTTNLPTLYISGNGSNSLDFYKSDGNTFLGTDLNNATPDFYITGWMECAS